jgi:RNA polymerase primary sigma factor
MALQQLTSPRLFTPADHYFREAGATDLLNADEEYDLAMRVSQGDIEARDHFVRANLRFVVMVARQFLGRGLPLDDLIQEGNMGLVHAVERFDPSMNVRFTTYAKHWVQQSILQALERSAPTIRIPGYAVDLVIKWRRTTAKLQDELGRAPTEEETAEAMQLTARQLKIIKKALRIHHHPGSSPLDEMLDAPKQQSIEDEPQRPSWGMEKTEELDHVLHLIGKLEEREAAVLRMRFGLKGGEPMILNDIGKVLGLTRERVRQIERQALAQLQEWLVD